MLKQLLHFDTVDGIQSYDSILKIYHCYNTKLNINKPLTNIKEISLKSLEIPLFFNNTQIKPITSTFKTHRKRKKNKGTGG